MTVSETTPGEPTPDEPSPGTVRAPSRDPWKGLRGVMAGTLVLEAIVVLLALPVVATVGGGLSVFSGVYVGGLGVAMIVASGLQRRPWALGLNLTLQVLAVAGFFIHPALGVMGLMFAALWAYLMYLRRDVQQRMAAGTLPSQQD